MKQRLLKHLISFSLLILIVAPWAQAQEQTALKLSEPGKTGGLSVMEAFSHRLSTRKWADSDISTQDLSDLLWAANGINRPSSKKRTAPSAGNAQDVDIYVFTRDGIYLYDAASHALNLITSGDHRSEIDKSRAKKSSEASDSEIESGAPVTLLLVTDISKFPFGSEDQKLRWGAIDVGIVSQNISIFCAGEGLGTCPMAGFDEDALNTLLKLKETQKIFLRHPVGYPPD